jgi:hypothetical protein
VLIYLTGTQTAENEEKEDERGREGVESVCGDFQGAGWPESQRLMASLEKFARGEFLLSFPLLQWIFEED